MLRSVLPTRARLAGHHHYYRLKPPPAAYAFVLAQRRSATTPPPTTSTPTRPGTEPMAQPPPSWVERLPPGIQPYLYLARVDKPIGTWLLLWPCSP